MQCFHSIYPSFCSRGGGGGVGCMEKCTLRTFLPQKWLCPWEGGGCLGKHLHSEHILATKVLMPVGGGFGCLGKCTLSTFLLQMCSCPWGGGLSRKMHYSGNVPGNKHILAYQRKGMQLIFELASCFEISSCMSYITLFILSDLV